MITWMAKDANELVIPAIDTTASNIVGSLTYKISGKFPYFFFFMKKFYTQKKHKMQTSEIKHLLFRHFKKI